MESLYIVIPAYNEEKNIKNLINDWYPVVKKISSKSRLIIINDGSTDNTLKVLEKEAKNNSQLIYLNKKNGGHGDTLIYGYNYAIKNNADFIFQTDADGQTLPSEFDDFWQMRNKFDVIIGNRIIREDGLSRKIVEKVLCLILRIIFKIKVPDANAPFRLMKTQIVKKYIKIMPKHYNLPNVILTTCFKYYNESLKFVPITFRKRQNGKNSINIKKITKIGFKALKDFKLIKEKMMKGNFYD